MKLLYELKEDPFREDKKKKSNNKKTLSSFLNQLLNQTFTDENDEEGKE